MQIVQGCLWLLYAHCIILQAVLSFLWLNVFRWRTLNIRQTWVCLALAMCVCFSFLSWHLLIHLPSLTVCHFPPLIWLSFHVPDINPICSIGVLSMFRIPNTECYMTTSGIMIVHYRQDFEEYRLSTYPWSHADLYCWATIKTCPLVFRVCSMFVDYPHVSALDPHKKKHMLPKFSYFIGVIPILQSDGILLV